MSMLDFDKVKLASLALYCAYGGLFLLFRNLYQEYEKFISANRKEGHGMLLKEERDPIRFRGPNGQE